MRSFRTSSKSGGDIERGSEKIDGIFVFSEFCDIFFLDIDLKNIYHKLNFLKSVQSNYNSFYRS